VAVGAECLLSGGDLAVSASLNQREGHACCGGFRLRSTLDRLDLNAWSWLSDRASCRIGKSIALIVSMSSPVITTIVKMVESLPDNLQEQVADHVRDYIAGLADQQIWDMSFKRTQNNLIAAAQQAKQEIAAGLAVPIDYDCSAN
jgi:hypothetical protein